MEDIDYEIGASSGLPAVSVAITYKRNTTELQRIRRAADTEQAKRIIANALEGYEAGIVILIGEYTKADFIPVSYTHLNGE